MSKITPEALEAFGFTSEKTVEFEWEKQYRSVRTDQNGEYGKDLLGLTEWSDGVWEAYIQTCEIGLFQSSCTLVRSVKTMEEIATLYMAIASDKNECLQACKTVVEAYEDDGMENMEARDHVMYQACKKALAQIHTTTKIK